MTSSFRFARVAALAVLGLQFACGGGSNSVVLEGAAEPKGICRSVF